MANPEDDWKIWLVINPAHWLVPIWFAVLATAVIIHLVVLHSPKYNLFGYTHKVEGPK
jgi:light-harvesting protein B-800-850 alpha chain